MKIVESIRKFTIFQEGDVVYTNDPKEAGLVRFISPCSSDEDNDKWIMDIAWLNGRACKDCNAVVDDPFKSLDVLIEQKRQELCDLMEIRSKAQAL